MILKKKYICVIPYLKNNFHSPNHPARNIPLYDVYVCYIYVCINDVKMNLIISKRAIMNNCSRTEHPGDAIKIYSDAN